MYPKYVTESILHTLTLKLPVQAYFDWPVMAQCTVLGCAGFKGFPIDELNELKLFCIVNVVSIGAPLLSLSHCGQDVWTQ